MAAPVLTAVAPPRDRTVRGVVLMLHGGRDRSTEPVLRRHASWWRMALLQRRLAHAVSGDGVAVELVRYAERGWNAAPGREAAPVRDGRWALSRLAAKYGEVPAVLVGHSMGGRAAVALAGVRGVRGVVALAPWLPDGEPVGPASRQRIVLAHGQLDRWTSPRGSLSWARRARAAGARVARFELPMVGHFMFASTNDWNAVVRCGALGLLGLRPLPRVVQDAFAEPGDGTDSGLRLSVRDL